MKEIPRIQIRTISPPQKFRLRTKLNTLTNEDIDKVEIYKKNILGDMYTKMIQNSQQIKK